MKGCFIVLEGPDGSGTTSHSTALVERLKSRGLSALHTFEATDGPIGTFIRGKLHEGGLPSNALQLLFTADRAWHVETVLRPAVERGDIIVCDRYSLSTIIYGTAQGWNRSWLESMNEPFIKPDLMLFALPSFEVCMQRLGKRTKDIIESDDDLQKRVYELYAAEARKISAAHVFDTSGDKSHTAMAIDAAIDAFLGL